MNLVLDIGNTRRKMGLFNGAQLIETQLVTDWTPEQWLQYCNQAGVHNVMIAQVTATDEALMAAFAQNFDLLELTEHTRLPFENKYTTPKTLGKDRLAAVAGAQALFPQQHCLVIDCGTCIKYDVLTNNGEYLGGNIAPGAIMRTKAMHTFTARLPEVDRAMPDHFIGNSTVTALQNGAFLGAVLEMDGFIGLFKAQFDPLKVLLTGGDAAFFKPYLKTPNLSIEPNLTLHGLNNILIFNR